MRSPCSCPLRQLLRVTSLAFIMALAMPCAQSIAAAEIPHENYDLMDEDIEVVIAMLNASIRASENALRSFDDEDVNAAEAYLEMVASVLEPAEAVLADIDEVAVSFDCLNSLLPPFLGLQREMTEFSELEGQLLEVRDEIVGLAANSNLSEVEAVAALDSIRFVNSVLARMNSTIDDMLIHAVEIDSLVIDNRTAFVPNELVELIELLRGLTLRLHEEISELIEEGLPWEDDRSFLIIWVEHALVYLGDEARGGGYLMVNGSFVEDQNVSLLVDGTELLSTGTTEVGAFAFNFTIPVNESWLGTHDLLASTDFQNSSMTSNTVVLTVSLVPTKIVLWADTLVLSPSGSAMMSAVLTDAQGDAIATPACVLSVDGIAEGFETDTEGRMEWDWLGSSLDYGRHEFIAQYLGELPYSPCESDSVIIVVDIPTELQLILSRDTIEMGDELEGECRLMANQSTPLPYQNISLSIDGTAAANISTDSIGAASFSLDAADIGPGTHILSAAFVDRDPIWRHSEDEAIFIVLDVSENENPLVPWIPGWDIGGNLIDQLRNLFFGEYAYLTWLFVILVVVVIVKALQARKRKARSGLPVEKAERVETTRTTDPWDGRGGPSASDRMPGWLTDPNEKIIWYYHSLLAYLKTSTHVGIVDTMTHWEVVRLLDTLGYPAGEAGRMAYLYEKAQYSGGGSTETDVAVMRSSAETIRNSGGVRPAA